MSVRPARRLLSVVRRQADRNPRFALTYLTTRFSRVARTRRARLTDARADGVLLFVTVATRRCTVSRPHPLPSTVPWRIGPFRMRHLEAFMVLDPDGRPS